MKTIKEFEELNNEEKVLFRKLVRKDKDTWTNHSTFSWHEYLLVMTPNPYIILKMNKGKGNSLEKAVNGLRQILKYLGISKAKAQKEDYTLNYDTGEKLKRLSWDKKLPKEQSDYINNFDW